MDTIESLISAYRNGTANPSKVVRVFLDKIEANNDYYSAYQSVWAEEAMALAD